MLPLVMGGGLKEKLSWQNCLPEQSLAQIAADFEDASLKGLLNDWVVFDFLANRRSQAGMLSQKIRLINWRML
jgi:hypothetical protein